MKKAIILLSGGLDSATVLAMAKAGNYELYPISFDYFQRHKVELDYAKKQAELQKCEKHHLIVTVDLKSIGGSALTSSQIDVPQGAPKNDEIPITYVPARNTVFLSLALGYAETVGSYDIFIGANSIDYSNYPDCRPQFIQAFENVANLGTRAADEKKYYKIHAPLINMTKSEIIKKGLSLGVNYSQTFSCYNPDIKGGACQICASCLIRDEGFKTVGVNER